MNTLPTLTFNTAVKTAVNRMNDFSGRSRRSEFWYWMLVVFLVKWFIGLFISNFLTSVFVDTLCMLAALAVTVRRLHDVGHHALWVYISYATGFLAQFLFAKSGYYELIMKMSQKGNFNDRAIMHFLESLPEWGIIIFVLSFILWMVTSLFVIIFCCMDSTPTDNKYGESVKYIA